MKKSKALYISVLPKVHMRHSSKTVMRGKLVLNLFVVSYFHNC